VENAIEHGISPALAGGQVQLQAQREGAAVVLRVRDDGLGLAPGWQDGTGLANCRERLRHHGNGRGTLVLQPLQPGTEAVLTLPEGAP
jgi:LytS/YehU family sensor histidine kinase